MAQPADEGTRAAEAEGVGQGLGAVVALDVRRAEQVLGAGSQDPRLVRFEVELLSL